MKTMIQMMIIHNNDNNDNNNNYDNNDNYGDYGHDNYDQHDGWVHVHSAMMRSEEVCCTYLLRQTSEKTIQTSTIVDLARSFQL